ncbi:hypothetical protein LPB19_16800 [Marinobacter salinisoli]|uniref:Amino acid transporter n=1 Tax=Marinobacter salinisoli TaxID=2769486 RepID=A0ABX7MR38_9GAMM|nr:hypothetical protein [Marinobacter salinisoli]QSP94806.1 hypothetical protein LPB19_16800 [Marinobacter salinisoli]
MDTALLVSGLVFSAVGIGYLVYGRRQSNMAARWSGFALILYPYLMTNVYTMIAVGVGLMLVPRFVDL